MSEPRFLSNDEQKARRTARNLRGCGEPYGFLVASARHTLNRDEPLRDAIVIRGAKALREEQERNCRAFFKRIGSPWPFNRKAA